MKECEAIADGSGIDRRIQFKLAVVSCNDRSSGVLSATFVTLKGLHSVRISVDI